MISKKIKFIILIIVFTIVVFYSKNIFAYSSLVSNKPTYGITSTSVNFRSQANTSSNKIRILAKGTNVKLVGVIDDFYIIELKTSEVGVIAKKYVTITTTPLSESMTYTKLNVTSAHTNTSNVFIRRGPGTNYNQVAKVVSTSTKFKVIGYIGDFYMVVLSDSTVGMIKKSLVTLENSNTLSNTNSSTLLETDEEIIFNLINNARKEKGLTELKVGKTLLKISRLKADDMTDKAYFSHTSPNYGSPFKMMQTYGITYKTAGENIAGNSDLKKAVSAWLNSETHKENLLSNKFNYIGIGISKSSIYGYIIVAMFAEV